MIQALAILLSVVLSFVPRAFAYPKAQLTECMLGAKNNPVLLGVPEKSLMNWCDCTLKSIFDEAKDDIASANQCAKKFFR